MNLLNKTVTVKSMPLVALRVAVGIMFSIAAYAKVSAGSSWPDRMVGFLNFQKNTGEFYQSFVTNVVIPNKALFGYATMVGEVVVAISLVFGLFSRAGALIGAFMVANFLLAKGTAFWMPSANDPMYILILLFLALVPSSKTWGLDYYIAKYRVK